MSDLDKLGQMASRRLRTLGLALPAQRVIADLLNTAYLASLRTEEGRFLRCSLTFADPRAPDIHPPRRRRADYPCFTPFEHAVPLNPSALTKLARAVDSWSASIAVWNDADQLFAWGVLDQLLPPNVQMHQEPTGAFGFLGMFTVKVDGVADVSIFHDDVFLGAVRKDRLVVAEVDAFGSRTVSQWAYGHYRTMADAIVEVFSRDVTGGWLSTNSVGRALCERWANSLARIAIGIRRLGTGGAVLLTPAPLRRYLDVGYELRYDRLADSIILGAIDSEYEGFTRESMREAIDENDRVHMLDVVTRDLAEADSEDRASETTGAIRMVTGLAGVDGLLLMSPRLHVHGFGTKIRCDRPFGDVYEGAACEKRGREAALVDTSRFGTRHGSILRYCNVDKNALGIVVSQDGNVRVVLSINGNLTLWDDVKLLAYENQSAKAMRDRRKSLTSDEPRERQKLGYTSMPKTTRELTRLARASPRSKAKRRSV